MRPTAVSPSLLKCVEAALQGDLLEGAQSVAVSCLKSGLNRLTDPRGECGLSDGTLMALDSASKMQEADANVQIVSELLLPLMKGFCVFSMQPHHKALGNIHGHNHAMFLPSSVNWKGLALGNLEICILVNIHLIYGPEGNSSFCFLAESPE